MAAYGNVLDFVIEQNVRCQYAVDDGDDLSDKKHDESAPSSPGMSATSEDCVEERYKVDRRKLEQMIQGKRSPGSVLVLSAKPLLTKHSTASLCKHTIRICRGMSRTVYK